MADFKEKERKKEDLFIKEKRKSKNFFVTSSAKMDGNKERTSTTISSSVFTKMKADFDSGDFLLDEHLISQNGSILYMMQQIQEDLEDVYNEVSASSFQSSYFPVARIDSGSFAYISSSGLVEMMSASIGGGIFTSASLAAGGGGSTDLSAVDSHIIPDTDDTYHLGASNKQFKNLYIDGIANIDSLSADSFVKPTAPVVQTAKTLKSSLVDVTGIHTLVLNSSNALSISGLAAAHEGQEITIMNIGSGAVTISRSTKASPRTIYGSSNITINQHQVYKFVCSPAQVWYAFV